MVGVAEMRALHVSH